MEKTLYLYENHFEDNFYVSTLELPLEVLTCNLCGDYDKLICKGTREQIFLSCQNEIDKIKAMISGKIPKNEEYLDLEYELDIAERDMKKLIKAFERFDE